MLLLLQSESRCRNVQHLVGLNGGVFQRATQRTSLARLQGQTVRVQALNAAVLVEQPLLVGHLLF